MSYTFTLTGKNSTLASNINPPLVLDDNEQYVLGVINFESYNSIPNIDSSNNLLHIGQDVIITIPEGSYEAEDIVKLLQIKLAQIAQTYRKNITLVLKFNRNTLKSEIKCTEDIDFTRKNSIGSLLGFNNKLLSANKHYISDHPVDIIKVNAICIECNLVFNSYNNGKPDHILHMFYPTTASGYKIVEKPLNVIYLPINTRYISEIVLKITDQDGNLVNLRGERVTVRLHLKKSS